MGSKRMNIANLFLDAADHYPERLAIVHKDKSINFSELKKQVLSTASYFEQKGIVEGDRVLVFVPMSIDLYRIVLALFHIGATAVFLDEWVSKERLLLCCRLADCKGFIGTTKARILGYFAKEIRNIPIKLKLNKRSEHVSSGRLVKPEASALITFTTGSTGIPKAADRSHQFLQSQFNILKEELKTDPMDVDMPVLPIVLFINLGVGCTSVIADYNSRNPKSLVPSNLVDQINQHKVSRIIASPYLIKRISTYLIEQNVKLDSIRQIFTGGAPVFPTEAGIYINAFENVDVNIIYGSTEVEPISGIKACNLIRQKGSLSKGLPVGKIHPKTELKIIPISNSPIGLTKLSKLAEMELEEGKIGEIIVAGNHVLKKYFRNEEAFKENKICVEGTIWHRTGDSGFVMENQLFLTGRCNQLIQKNNRLLSPFIMENLLQNIEGLTLGTMVEHKSNLILVVETMLEQSEVGALVSEFDYDKLVVLKKIPRDPRHFSKIDYGRLKEMLD